MASNQAMPPRQVLLGQRMCDLRKRAGLIQEDVAVHMSTVFPSTRRSKSHVSRWESGLLLIAENELIVFLELVRATSTETAQALLLHRDAADPNYLLPGIGRELALVREYEDTAMCVVNVQPMLIPGPLQERSYAEFVIHASGATEAQAADLLAFRMARRDSLLSGATTDYTAIIGEHAIRYPGCPRKVAISQHRDLIQSSMLGHITILVLPFDDPERDPDRGWYHAARHGSFVLFESATTKPVVHLEHYRSSSTLTDVRDVRDYQNAAERLRRDAMSPESSSRLIAEVADKLESTL